MQKGSGVWFVAMCGFVLCVLKFIVQIQDQFLFS